MPFSVRVARIASLHCACSLTLTADRICRPTRHHMAGTMAGVKHPNVFKNFGMVAEEEYTAQL